MIFKSKEEKQREEDQRKRDEVARHALTLKQYLDPLLAGEPPQVVAVLWDVYDANEMVGEMNRRGYRAVSGVGSWSMLFERKP